MEGSREDDKLVCSIAYHDPNELWPLLKNHVEEFFPLSDITFQSPLSASDITLSQLPVTILPLDSRLYKDCDHPYRWFLAPYVTLFLVTAESLEAYAAQKANINAWVQRQTEAQLSVWQLLYVPIGAQTMMVYEAVFGALSRDFYSNKPGDRCTMMIPGQRREGRQLHRPGKSSSAGASGISDGRSRNSSGVRGSSSSGTNSKSNYVSRSINMDDFGEKVGLSIIQSFKTRCKLYMNEIRRLDVQRGSKMFDFRQIFLVKESLALMLQMMQLPSEALIQYEEIETLLNFAQNAQKKVEVGQAMKDKKRKQKENEKDESAAGEKSSSSSSKKAKGDKWSEVGLQADAILKYSINTARMKVLKNRMGLLEMSRYIFAREVFFMLNLRQPALCASKALSFIKSVRVNMETRLHSFTPRDVSNDPAEEEAASREGAAYRCQLSNFWAIVASLRVVTTCTEAIHKSKRKSKREPKTNLDKDSTPAVTSDETDARESPPPFAITSPSQKSARGTGLMGKADDTSLHVGNLLQYSSYLLLSLLTTEFRDDPLRDYQDQAAMLVNSMKTWRSFDTVMGSNVSKKEFAFSESVKKGADVFNTNPEEISHFTVTLEGLLRDKWAASAKEASPHAPGALAAKSAELVLQLTRILVDHHRLAGRSRFAASALAQCADILLCQRRVDQALPFILCALDALDNSNDRTEKYMEQEEDPSAWRQSTSFSKLFPRGLQVDTDDARGNREWARIHYSLLRRLLFCYRFKAAEETHDAKTKSTCEYIAVAIQLLDPRFAKLFDAPSDREELQRDIMTFATSSMPGAELPARLKCVFAAHPLFTFAVVRTAEVHNDTEDNKGAALVVKDGEKNLRGIGYPVTTILYEARKGRDMPSLTLSLNSRLPMDIALQEGGIQLIMERFLVESLYGTQRGSDEGQSDEGLPFYMRFGPGSEEAHEYEKEYFYGYMDDDLDIATTLQFCSLGSSPDGEDLLRFSTKPSDAPSVVRPGRQDVSLAFQPTTAGEFAPVALLFTIGRFTFVDTVIRPASWLMGLSRHDIFLTITAPADALSVRSDIPAFCALDQPDCLVLHVEIMADDVNFLDISENHKLASPPDEWVVSAGKIEVGRGVTIREIGTHRHLTIKVPFVLKTNSVSSATAELQEDLSFILDVEFFVGGCRVRRSVTHSCTLRGRSFLDVGHRVHTLMGGVSVAENDGPAIVEYFLKNMLRIPLTVTIRFLNEVDEDDALTPVSGNGEGDSCGGDGESSTACLLPGQTFSKCLQTSSSGSTWSGRVPCIDYTYSRQDELGIIFTQKYEPKPLGSLLHSGLLDSLERGPSVTQGLLFELTTGMGDGGLLLGSRYEPMKLTLVLRIHPHNAATSSLQSTLEQLESRVVVQFQEHWQLKGPQALKFVLNEAMNRIIVQTSFTAVPLAMGQLDLPFLKVDSVNVYPDIHTKMLVI